MLCNFDCIFFLFFSLKQFTRASMVFLVYHMNCRSACDNKPPIIFDITLVIYFLACMKGRITVFPAVPQTISVMAVIDITNGDIVSIDGSRLAKVTERVCKGFGTVYKCQISYCYWMTSLLIGILSRRFHYETWWRHRSKSNSAFIGQKTTSVLGNVINRI